MNLKKEIEQEQHSRKQLRLVHYDYSGNGCYFITVCSHQKECVFGSVDNGVMRTNELGKIVSGVWEQLPKRFPNISVNPYIIMPNHIHALITIDFPAAQGCGKPHPYGESHSMQERSQRGNVGLPGILRTYKSISTLEANRRFQTPGRKLWQRNYYEHIVRNERDLQDIVSYIQNNPLKWDGFTP